MKKLAIVILSLIITACASNNVVVDTHGVDLNQYAIDLRECKEYQKQVSMGDGVAESVLVGVLVGAAVGAITGNSDTATEAGSIAGLEAGTGRAIQNDHERANVLKNCLAQRGYRVLN